MQCFSAFFYAFIITPIETYIVVDWFYIPIAIVALPFILAITASRYTRLAFYGGRRHRRSSNYRLRCHLAYLQLGGAGTVRISQTRQPRSSWGDSSDDQQERPSSPFTPSTIAIDSLLQEIDVLSHHHFMTSLLTLNIPTRYKSISPSDNRYKRILLEAKGLRTSLRAYRETLPLQTPTVYISSLSSELPIVIDTGASCSVTPNLKDFITTPTVPETQSMEGLNGDKTTVVGAAQLRWDIEDVNGVRSDIETFGYFIPTANIRLFSPQVYLQEQHQLGNKHCHMRLNSNEVTLLLADKTELKFPIQPGNNLPIMLTHETLHPTQSRAHLSTHVRQRGHYENLSSFLCSTVFHAFNEGALFQRDSFQVKRHNLLDSPAVLHKPNWNLSTPQQELLLWHHRIGHVNMKHIQTLLANPKNSEQCQIIKPSNNKSSNCTLPLCIACQFAKQKRRNPPSALKQARSENEGALSRNVVIPGQRVSVDLYQSSTKGRLAHTFGKEKSDLQFTGGAIFVDHATRLVHHTHQFSTTAAETIGSKHKFEQFSDEYGVKIKEYVGDNNPFHSNDWEQDCLNQGQQRNLSGVGAHHQNHAERSIQTIFNMARAMLLHFAVHWPQAATTNLWPFAVDHAIYIWNRLPNPKHRISPMEHFTSTAYPDHNHLKRLHVFGCPVFVLDAKLQDGKKIPKWQRRSRRGVYLGVSRNHSTTVHLVLNLETGKISPQYHVVFDDTYSTVFSNGEFNDNVWDSLVASNSERHPDADIAVDIVPFQSPSLDQPDQPLDFERGGKPTSISTPTPSVISSETLPTASTTDSTIPNPSPAPTTPSSKGPISFNPTGGPISVPEGANEPSIASPDNGTPPLIDNEPVQPRPSPRRSSRARKTTEKFTFKKLGGLAECSIPKPKGPKQTRFGDKYNTPRVTRECLNQQYLAGLNWNRLLSYCTDTTGTLASFASELRKNSPYNQIVEYLNPALLVTIANKEDNPTFKEAMASPDSAGFIKAMEIEIRTLIELDVFDVVMRPKQKVISGVWAFKRKRYPDGTVRKLKARYCARGFEQQQGIDYFETFAPVVMWLTVRLLLIMSILMNLETKQIDYTAAFVHAPIDCTVYVDMPLGFAIEGHVWRLKKSLYGLAQSPRNFFLHTRNQLVNKLGFQQTDADPCLFVSDSVICLIYVDDALLFYRDSAAVDQLTSRMEAENIQFREEEDVAGFLGVHIDHQVDEHGTKTIHLTQKGLTERIVAAMNLDSPTQQTASVPATGYLPIDEFGEPAHETFDYRSVVGQLNYLQGHSRPDITMATSQVARFVHKPKRSHELALIQIGLYLKGTLDKGLILKPKNEENNLNLDVYVDAAFACGWGTEEGTNPDSVKSRTGYIIELANCPVLWVSKMQSTIATSTMESEYTALSMALRAFIPLQAVAEAVTNGLHFKNEKQITFKATVHEDNQGALTLAKLEPGRTTMRSKFYALRLHWFRSWIHRNKIEIVFIETQQQKADFLTKAPAAVTFRHNRKLTMGW